MPNLTRFVDVNMLPGSICLPELSSSFSEIDCYMPSSFNSSVIYIQLVEAKFVFLTERSWRLPSERRCLDAGHKSTKTLRCRCVELESRVSSG